MLSLLFWVIAFQALAVFVFIKVSWWVAIFPEIFVAFLMLSIPYAFFRRCPVCGKRRLTLDLDFDKGDGATDIGRCRNCKSHVSIQKKGYSRYIYYVEDEHGKKERVVPIWRTLKRKENYETPKYRKGGEVSKRIKSHKTSGYVKDYDTSNYRKV